MMVGKGGNFIIQTGIIERILIFTILISCAWGISSAGQIQPPDHVVISEVYPDPKASWDKCEFIELYNPTGTPIDLTNWTLIDDDGHSATLSGTIPSHGFYLIGHSDYDQNKDDSNWPDADLTPPDFPTMSNSGDEVKLKNSLGELVDTVGYGDSAESHESSPFAPVPDEGESLQRKSLPGSSAPNKDTDDNLEDFQILSSPSPSGTASNRIPIADFTFSPSSPTTQDTIQFTDQSTDSDGTISSWNWDFGDGNNSTAQNPTHQYADHGTYQVTLTVTDDDGATDSISKDVTVANVAPTADAGGPYACNLGDTITLDGSGSSDSDGSISKYEWDLNNDDQYDEATGVSSSYSCSPAGSYTVGLKVTDDDDATDIDFTTVNVNSPPAADFTYSPSNPTAQNSIQFTDQSNDSDGTIASWDWDFGDETGSNEQNPNHKYSDSGIYLVTLTVTDDGDATDTTSKEIKVRSTVGADPPIYKNIVTFPTPEYPLGRDLNGDGDTEDWILRYMDLKTGQVINTGLIASSGHRSLDIYDKIIVFEGNDSGIYYYDINSGKAAYVGTKGSSPSIYENTIAFVSKGTIHYYNIRTNRLVDTGVEGNDPVIHHNLIAFVDGYPSTIHYYDLYSDKAADTDLVGEHPSLHKDGIAFSTQENEADKDLNGDGDMRDEVIRYYDIRWDEVVNTRAVGRYPVLYDNLIAFSVDEGAVNKDLNDDGDIYDSMIYYYDLNIHQLYNTKKLGTEPDIYEDTISFYLYESWPGLDLSGDGDFGDPIVETYQISGQEILVPPHRGDEKERSSSLVVESLKAYPIPVTSQDTLHVEVEGQGIEAMKLEVFDLTGRAVYESDFLTGKQLEWRLNSNTGEVLTNGLYLFGVTVKGPNGEVWASRIRKLLVLR